MKIYVFVLLIILGICCFEFRIEATQKGDASVQPEVILTNSSKGDNSGRKTFLFTIKGRSAPFGYLELFKGRIIRFCFYQPLATIELLGVAKRNQIDFLVLKISHKGPYYVFEIKNDILVPVKLDEKLKNGEWLDDSDLEKILRNEQFPEGKARESKSPSHRSGKD